MAGKKVAVDVKATPSKQKHHLDTLKSGSWQVVGQPIKQPTMKLKSETGKLLFMAVANFIYQGASFSGPSGPVPLPPIPAPPLQLKAKKTKLVEGGKNVLVKGDKNEDNFGNELAVSKVSGKLSTT